MAKRRAELPLARDPASRLLPWIIAFMVYLAGLALSGALVVGDALRAWERSRTGMLTVEVPAAADGSTELRLEKALEVLHETEGVVRATALTRAELVALLEPWLGEGRVAQGLPLPGLIDVTVAPGAALDLAALERRVAAAVPGASVDDPERWLRPLVNAARSVQAVAAAVVILVVAALAVTVVLATRTGLSVHHEAIEVLHLIGAQDWYVARQFQVHALWLGLKGGLVGAGLAALTVVGIASAGADLETALLPRVELGPAGWAALAALPLMTALLAMITARVTVLRVLVRLT